jgi:DNA replication protein
MSFTGFPEDTSGQIAIPEQFFHQVLFTIDNLDELKMTLYIFWQLQRREGPLRYLSMKDLSKDKTLLDSFGKDTKAARKTLSETMQSAAQRGTLLLVESPFKGKRDQLIFLNSPRGRAAVEAIHRGEWSMLSSPHAQGDAYTERPNIYQLYEANIGPLTPMIADALRDAEKGYQAKWIEDAFQIAIKRNKRSWHYIEAILRHWQEGGRDDRKDQKARRDTEEARRRYAEWEK